MRLRERLRGALPIGPRLLVVTAVEAERAAVLKGLASAGAPLDDPADAERVAVETVGVGPAAAASMTARLLALAEAAGVPFGAVVCAGIAGGFAGRAEPGSVVIATRSVAADLGADSPDGFLPLTSLGFGVSIVDSDPTVLAALTAARPDAVVAEVLTVSTVTGTADRAAELAARHPNAAAEAMEGFGAAIAAMTAGVPFVELRSISNPVGPRDRGAWRIDEALAALAEAAAALDGVRTRG